MIYTKFIKSSSINGQEFPYCVFSKPSVAPQPCHLNASRMSRESVRVPTSHNFSSQANIGTLVSASLDPQSDKMDLVPGVFTDLAVFFFFFFLTNGHSKEVKTFPFKVKTETCCILQYLLVFGVCLEACDVFQ